MALLRISPTQKTALALDERPLVVVDPMSTGATLASAADEKGVPVICVWSDVSPKGLRGHAKQTVDYLGVVVHQGDLAATCDTLLSVGGPVRCVIVSAR